MKTFKRFCKVCLVQSAHDENGCCYCQTVGKRGNIKYCSACKEDTQHRTNHRMNGDCVFCTEAR